MFAIVVVDVDYYLYQLCPCWLKVIGWWWWVLMLVSPNIVYFPFLSSTIRPLFVVE